MRERIDGDLESNEEPFLLGVDDEGFEESMSFLSKRFYKICFLECQVVLSQRRVQLFLVKRPEIGLCN